jgi:hypothetical protein
MAGKAAVEKALTTYTDAEIEEMAYGLLGEAESLGVVGMTGVAHVVRNRAESPVFSKTGDAYEVFTHDGWFSAFDDGIEDVKVRVAKSAISKALFEEAKKIVTTVIAGEARPPDPTGKAVYYHVDGETPYWASSVKTPYGTVSDGGHLFYATAPQETDFGAAAAAIDANFSTPIPVNRPTNPIQQTSGVEMARVIQAQTGATNRVLPISDDLSAVLAYAATKNGVYLEIYSGGQDPAIPGTVPPGASPRHNGGNAADMKAYVLNADGSKRYLNWTNEADQKIWAGIVADAVSAGAVGVGAALGYMGPESVHIGFGGAAVWGQKKTAFTKGSPPADWISDAWAVGLAMPRPDLGLPTFAYYDNPKGVPQGREAKYWGIDPVEDAIEVTPVLEWDESDPEATVVNITAPQIDAYYDPDRGAFFLNELIDDGSLDNIDQTALSYAMAAANLGQPPADVGSLYAGILPIRSEIVLRAGGARPEGPAAGMPKAPYQPMVIGRPEAPVGQLPQARQQTTVAGRPDAPIGALPAAASVPDSIVPTLPPKWGDAAAMEAEVRRLRATGMSIPDAVMQAEASVFGDINKPLVPMDQSNVQARATILDAGFGSLLGIGPLPATRNPITMPARSMVVPVAPPAARIDAAVAENRAGSVSSTAADVTIKTVTVRGEPVQTAPTGAKITASQQLAIQSISKTITAAVSKPSTGATQTIDPAMRNAISAVPKKTAVAATTVTVHKDGTTSTSPKAGSVQLPAGVKPQILTPKPAVPATTTKTITETKMVPVVNYVRPEGPVGALPAAPVVKLSAPTQTIDPAMRNAISAVPAGLLPQPPVVKPAPAPLKKVVTYKKVVVTKKVVVPVKSTVRVYDEGSGKVVVVQQSGGNPAGPMTIRGANTGNLYTVGQTYQAGDYKYVANADGTFSQVKGSGSGTNKNNSNPGVNKMGVKIGSGGVFGGSDVGSGVASSTNPGGI